MADYLQENMKKLCEGNLSKIQIANIEGKTYSSLIEMQQDEFMKQREEYLKGNQEAMLSGIEGMASSIIGGVVGLVGGTAWGLGKEIRGDGFSYGYWDFNERFVNPTLQSIRDSAPNQDAYDIGYVGGIVVPMASGVIGFVNSAGKVETTINIAKIGNGVAAGEIALSGASAMELINSFVQASIGVGAGSTSAENQPNGNELKFGSDTKSTQKLNNEMSKRGWTEETVKDTVNNPYTTRKATNKATGNSATAYYNQNGAYVVIDDITKEVVQVSDNINPSSWIPDSSIIDPYRP